MYMWDSWVHLLERIVGEILKAKDVEKANIRVGGGVGSSLDGFVHAIDDKVEELLINLRLRYRGGSC